MPEFLRRAEGAADLLFATIRFWSCMCQDANLARHMGYAREASFEEVRVGPTSLCPLSENDSEYVLLPLTCLQFYNAWI